MQTAIERIEEHTKLIASGNHERIRPGQPQRFSEAASVNDAIRQGDLYLIVVDAVPDEYVQVVKPKVDDKQLVPGSTQGSRHCLDSLTGVRLYRPESWPNSGLRGPCLVLTEERTIEHPTHGHVTIPPGNTILCGYQRELDAETRMERRNAD